MDTKPTREMICKDSLVQYLPDLVERVFDTKQKDFKLIQSIQKTMKRHLKQSEWLENKEKKKAITKLKTIKSLIGIHTSRTSYPRLVSHEIYPSHIKRYISTQDESNWTISTT